MTIVNLAGLDGWVRGVAVAGAVGLACGLGSAPARAQVGTIIVSGNPSTDAMNRPIFATWAPGDYRRIFVIEKAGKIRSIDISAVPPVTQATASAFLDVAATTQQPGGTDPNQDERGLLGLAFHPGFQTNGKFYIYRTIASASGIPSPWSYYNEVLEYVSRDPSTLTVDPARAQADPASARVVMRIPHPSASNHNGGWMGFGPDGYLYIAVGDGGNAGDQQGTNGSHNLQIGNGLDTGRPLGKMLRIDINVTTAAPQGPFWAGGTGAGVGVCNYGIPSDNPVLPVVTNGTSPARLEIWAYGLRNPWRNSFDKSTGDLWIADVQQGQYEELNYQPALNGTNAAAVAGRNYGWRCFEGSVPYDRGAIAASQVPNLPCAGTYDSPGFTPPVGVYAHSTALANVNPAPPRLLHVAGSGANFTGIAVTGGYVYRGCRIPEIAGQYMFTDYLSGSIYTTTRNATTGILNDPTLWSSAYAANSGPNPDLAAVGAPTGNAVSFGQDAYGELYIVSQGQGRVIKFVSTAVGSIPLANADHDRNGTLSVQDIFGFLSDWFSSSTRTDYNRSGGIEVQDIFDFLAGWFGGCVG